MTKTVLLFGLCMAVMLALLKWAEYMFFARDLALEAYVGIVGLLGLDHHNPQCIDPEEKIKRERGSIFNPISLTSLHYLSEII